MDQRTKVILDFSANTHKNETSIIRKAINEIKSFDTGKCRIIFKSQLFEEAGENIVCDRSVFEFMHGYCNDSGYECTASVFDKSSLDFLLKFDIPFVKIANNEKFYHLCDEVPRRFPTYVSIGHNNLYRDDLPKIKTPKHTDVKMCCISKYPASIEDYEDNFESHHGFSLLKNGQISDHTIGLDLFNKYTPRIWEKHLKLSDSTGLDAGAFAITPKELSTII